MALSIMVKNTFVDIDTKDPTAPLRTRRSSSIPCTWKPGLFIECDSPHSDDSTMAFSDSGSQDVADCATICSDCTDLCVNAGARWADISEDLETSADETVPSKVTLTLAEMVPTENSCQTGDCKVRSKLRSQAQLFRSVRQPPADLQAVIARTVTALKSSKDIVDVKVHDGGMGGTTMIVAESSSEDPNALWTLSLAKDAFLSSAEQSESTYILGYGAMPFSNLDNLSFSCRIACMAEAHQDSACWDFYEKGHCARCTTCHWHHPADNDIMRMIVMIKKGGASF
jgi:hypothetical protein